VIGLNTCFEGFQDDSEVGGCNFVICDTLAQPSIVILIQPSVHHNFHVALLETSHPICLLSLDGNSSLAVLQEDHSWCWVKVRLKRKFCHRFSSLDLKSVEISEELFILILNVRFQSHDNLRVMSIFDIDNIVDSQRSRLPQC
jgi:hypothetical protein